MIRFQNIFILSLNTFFCTIQCNHVISNLDKSYIEPTVPTSLLKQKFQMCKHKRLFFCNCLTYIIKRCRPTHQFRFDKITRPIYVKLTNVILAKPLGYPNANIQERTRTLSVSIL